MKKITLQSYKDFKQYFSLLDVLIKDTSSNKDLFLEDIDISPSSYRRAKNEGNKIGEIILKKLSKHFGYKTCSLNFINQIEDRINEIYYDIYYKDYTNYDIHLNWLDNMISEKYIIFPIFKLFKLLMIINNKNNPRDVLKVNQVLYDEIKNYEKFYEQELLEILEILDVTFKQDIDDYFLSRTYINELTYHTLASRCSVLGRYLESIYFCEIAKEKYILDENYKRVYYINLILISNYNYLFKFDEAYLLTQKQLHNLKALKEFGKEYEFTELLQIIACLGLKKYDKVIELLYDKENVTLTETISLLVALYYTNINKYKTIFTEFVLEMENSNSIQTLNLLNEILTTNNRKKINELGSQNINKCLLEILKKM